MQESGILAVQYPQMDWVEKRAARDAAITLGRERFWGFLTNAIDHAVDSYNRLYSTQAVKVQVIPQYENVIVVSCQSLYQDVGFVRLTKTDNFINADISVIDRNVPMTPTGPVVRKTDKRLEFDVSETGAFVVRSGAEVLSNVEAVSELLLKPILFPLKST